MIAHITHFFRRFRQSLGSAWPLGPLHAWLCRKVAVYQRWHQHRYHRPVHLSLLGVYILALAVVTSNAFVLPHTTLAVNDTTQTWQFLASSASDYTTAGATITDSGAEADHPNQVANPSFSEGIAGWTTAALPPAGWVEVPGNPLYGTENFLVMKYEAKCAAISDPTVGLTSANTGYNTWPDNSAPCTAENNRQVVSTPTGYPLANITQITSGTRAASITLGSTSAHLITNNEWMTIARDAESQDHNWSKGSVGNGYLFAGHNNAQPNRALEASSNDANKCAFTGNSADEAPTPCPTNVNAGTSGSGGNQVRTVTLSNGSTVWDLGGNVYEWTSDTILSKDQPDQSGSNGFTWRDYTAITSFDGLTRDQVSPAGNYDYQQGVGRIYSNSNATDSTEYGFLRGAYWTNTTSAGLFALNLYYQPSNSNYNVGLRASSDPVAISQSYQSTAGREGGATQISVGPVADAKLYQSIATTAATTYNYSLYVHDQTEGNEAGPVDASVASLYAGGNLLSTTYTDQGDGWWKLSTSLAGTGSTEELGLALKTGKTVLVDDVTLINPAVTYSLYTTAAYSNSRVASWDSLTPTSTLPAGSSLRYQLCDDEGATCESDHLWQYWDGNSWSPAADLTQANLVSDLTLPVMRAFSADSQKISLKVIFQPGEGDRNPRLQALALGLTTDTTGPLAPATITMHKTASGSVLNQGDWTNQNTPTFSWDASEDEPGGSGMKGYCLYLGLDSTADPGTTKGLLGATPSDPSGTSCPFFTTGTSIDFADSSLRGAAWLTSSTDPYFLLVDAVDIAGNTSDAARSFPFRFDNTPPDKNPAFVSVSPTGYSATNSFTFLWPTSGTQMASDVHSGLAGYQWRTGASSGPYSNWSALMTTAEVSVDDIAYQEGANTFQLRAVDTAGNPAAAPVTATFYYAGSAPTAPQNLSVTPTSTAEAPASQNAFAFSWQPPATSSSPIKQYRYSVNALPTSANTIILTGTSLSAAPFATQQGKNTLYVVAEDEAGNVNYNVWASVDFFAQTPAPGMPTSLSAVDGSNRDLQDYKVFLTWVAPASKGTGFAGYEIFRSDGSDFTSVGTTSGTTYADTGLDSKEYAYYVKSRDNAGQYSVASGTVTITPTGRYTLPPNLESGPDVTATAFSSRISWETDREASTIVRFGTSEKSLSQETSRATELIKKHQITLQGLEPSTLYYYQALWIDRDGNLGKGKVASFQTSERPRISNVKISNITLSSAIISWTSTTIATSGISFGPTSAYGQSRTDQSGSQTTAHTIILDGLNHSTPYHFQITGTDTDGNRLSSDDYTFATLTKPVISNLRFETLKDSASSSLKFTWDTNVPTTSIVSYKDPDGRSLSRSAAEYTTSHEIIVDGLLDQTTYQLIARSVDRYGNEAVSDENVFTTPDDTRPPKVSNLTVEVRSSGVGVGQKAQLVVSWETDEPASSQVEFGPGISAAEYPQKSQEDKVLTTSHVVIVSELEPAKLYHLRAVSRDRAGNLGSSADTTAITGKMQRSVIDVIIGSLERSLSFLGSLSWGRQ